jgi:hypothetical protein
MLLKSYNRPQGGCWPVKNPSEKKTATVATTDLDMDTLLKNTASVWYTVAVQMVGWRKKI